MQSDKLKPEFDQISTSILRLYKAFHIPRNLTFTSICVSSNGLLDFQWPTVSLSCKPVSNLYRIRGPPGLALLGLSDAWQADRSVQAHSGILQYCNTPSDPDYFLLNADNHLHYLLILRKTMLLKISHINKCTCMHELNFT